MDLEKLNNDYLRLKVATEKFKTILEQYENDLKLAEKDKETAENNLKVATKPAEKKKYQADLNKAIINIDYIKIQIETAKNQQQKVQEDINKIIADVKEIPEVKEQCNRAIDIRTQRQIAKFEKQKKEQEEKKENLEQLKNMIEKHPQAIMIVNNIENKSLEISKKDSEIKDVEEEIDKLDPTDPNYAIDKAKLDADKAKLETERKTLAGERQTERNNLKKLFNNPKYNEEIDNLTTRAALDKSISNCDRLIRRSENKIHDYTYARDSLYKVAPVATATAPAPTAPAPTAPAPTAPAPTTVSQSKWETFKGLFGKREAGAPSRWESFKSLFTKKPALPEPTTPEPTTVKSFKDEIKLDGDVMRHEIVQEIYKEALDKKVEQGKSER